MKGSVARRDSGNKYRLSLYAQHLAGNEIEEKR